MEKKSGFTLLELIVGIISVIVIIVIINLYLSNLRKPYSSIYCGTNLKGLGTAMTVYACDYDDEFPQLPGNGPWSKRLGFDYDYMNPDFSEGGAEENVSRTITASLYLLVREADVSPKSFICPQLGHNKNSDKSRFTFTEFTGANRFDLDLVELRDFGSEPHQHVSYAYHNPYGKFPANYTLSATFAVAADMNPWIINGDFVKPGSDNQPPQILTISDALTRDQIKTSNASYHEYDGQNVLYADGHSSFEKQPNTGIKDDNIYTFWSSEENPTEQDKQGGTAPTSRSPENDAKSREDSFLAI